MALYQHRFEGHLPIGTPFGFAWWSDSVATLDLIQGAAVSWLSTFWDVNVAALYDAGFGFDRVKTAEVLQATGVQLNAVETTVTEVGTGAGDSVSADSAIVTSLRTDTTARVGRGRFYLPGGLVTQIDGPGRIAAATITALDTALTAAWAAYVSTGTPVIYSRTDRLMRQITRYDIGDLWDTQRRRERKAIETRTVSPMPV